MLKAFKMTTNAIIGCLLLSIVLHVIWLLFTENNAYRQWVIVQIILQTEGVISLVFVRSFEFISVAVFAAISLTFIYINATYVIYGHTTAHMVLFLLFWMMYGGLIIQVRGKFIGSAN